MSSRLSWIILKRFSLRNMSGFTYQDAVKEFPALNLTNLSNILAEMVDQGMLCRIGRDKYLIIPLIEDPESYVPDVLQAAKHLMQDRQYYVGYGSALRFHGLMHQTEGRETAGKEYVVTNVQMKPAIRIIRGVTYQFIQHDDKRFFGFTSIWISLQENAVVSDLEKTIVDIATKPQNCGGIIEVGNAIFRSRERINYEKLFYYFARNRRETAKKRYLFLSELLGLEWTAEHDLMLEGIGYGNTLLDPGAPDQGRIWSKFGMKINVDPRSIQKAVFHNGSNTSKQQGAIGS